MDIANFVFVVCGGWRLEVGGWKVGVLRDERSEDQREKRGEDF